MRIIQNIDLVELIVNKNSSTVYFPSDKIFAGKKIKEIRILSDAHIAVAPNSLNAVIPSNVLKSAYIHLYNAQGKQISKNLLAQSIIPSINQEIRINEILDFKQTYIQLVDTSEMDTEGTPDYSLLIAVYYQTQNFTAFTEPTNFKNISIPVVSMQKKYDLKEFLANVPGNVRRISIDKDARCLLTLRDKTGLTINQLPDACLRDNDTFLDAYCIDFDNSFLECPDGTLSLNNSIEITLHYE